jgi:hypothetical protein
MQDKLIRESGIPDLIVGDLVDATGAKATALAMRMLS